MILNICQTKTNFDMEWEIRTVEGQPFAIAKAPFENGRYNVVITYKSLKKQRLYYNPSDTTWGSGLKDRLSFKVMEGDQKIGHIVGQTKKTGFLKAYAYYEFQKNGRIFYGYEVGFGHKGLYLCLYDGDKLVATVDKQLRVVNFKDSYTAYICDESYADAIILFTIYYDSVSYGDVLEIRTLSVQHKCVNTRQKEVLEKYDPTFIQRVIEKDFPRGGNPKC